MAETRRLIEQAFDDRENLSPTNVDADTRAAVNDALAQLDAGHARIAEPTADGWVVNDWLKKAVLVSFRLTDNQPIDGTETRYYDKVPLKYAAYSDADFEQQAARVVPPAVVRRGAHIEPNAVLMPSYVNIGAWVDRGAMIDTWATVGSCAQVGKNVHLSGGAGLGGVLEPLQAAPTIVEDNCFIGARSEIVEGVRIGRGAVISMGVFIGASTAIYDRETDSIIHGEVPPGSVVVAGSLPRDNGRYNLNCAVIVKKVDEATRAKVAVNDLLRGVNE
ncbi:2,3,4,5-tetrahydropyridine-2,6-dicarboxylate N-succinyltransferase [Salinisphaera sp. USBA-960]|uniref:2,3,4,5-tetrahydropyridine-2,6-dicarboxylate N-succinyltransferase n=1 Tax=Salinisphaera orenii TaxID=856731 RepID=UPI000DBE2644|nr:2,3,4,5-tetrahydropyridine-2,6-dicarboxylate N-succinyltransferase [Salifodinibacter halophilus]NNC26237.1 2,3,4,5-tetrahydropyridine-2,6-dicarboxylate N-succinyltransferase [Salifodinibacter halophilus]